MTDLTTRLMTAKRVELETSEDVSKMLATVDVFLADGPERTHDLAAVLALVDMEPTADELAAMMRIVQEDHASAVRVLSFPRQRNIDFSATDKAAVVDRLAIVRERRLGALQMAAEALEQS